MSHLPEPEPRSEVGARAATAGLDRRALDDLLAALAGLDSQERNALLSEAGAGSGLRDELLSRVATGAATGPLAESEEARGGDAAEAPRPGARVGPYRLERELAQGGMGTVYQAVRADDAYRKQVAVKLLRAPVPAPELLARFRAERQILAQLDHPHIARLLDGGRTKDGVPYLVMEFVQGQPITESCDRRRLAIAERVRLLATVCAAVQYAHQNLVIHRDLKPSNILVGEDGLPKLLDFGIAKLLRADGEGPTVAFTQTAVRLMTPEYASPEQIRGEPVSTASDVYSLGVLLYELLTGQRPHRLETGSLQEMEQRVCREEAVRPSETVRRLGGKRAQEIADRRGVRPEQLVRRLGGDLDNITRKALEKEPARRYASADQLAQDLGRHLDGHPVLARPDTLRYRAGKFVRRHRASVAVAAVFSLLLASFGVSMAVQASRLASERNKALVAEREARQVSSFLTELFRISDPSESRGNAVTAREILDRGAERIGSDLKDQPLVQAALMDTMGVVYRKLGLRTQAADLLQSALDTRSRLLGEMHLDTAKSLNDLAEILREKGDLQGAEPLYRRALEVRTRLLGPLDPAVGESCNNLGLLLESKNQLQESEALYLRALEIYAKTLGEHHPKRLVTLANLGQLLRGRGDSAGAEKLYREVLRAREATLGHDHPQVANSLSMLGSLLNAKGQYAESESVLRESLRLRRKLLGDEHPDVASSLNNLASLLQDKGDLNAAEATYREALALQRKLSGNRHMDVAVTLNNLATLLEDRGDAVEAEALYRESLSIRHQQLGSEHPSVARAMHNLGRALVSDGKLGEGGTLLRQALAVRRQKLAPGHPELATSLVALAGLAQDRRDLETAERLFREALAIRQQKLPATHPQTAEAQVGLGRVLSERRRHQAAEPLLRQARASLAQTLRGDHPQLARAEAALGACLLAQGRRVEAEPLLTGAHAKLLARLGPRSRASREAAKEVAALRSGS
ncbi:MAG TPA: serine/threonine-protein kinase [Vicinamibacteria bacterium]|nr:serine/threonine-protein kinase [Vicinamibacteria bacterium]